MSAQHISATLEPLRADQPPAPATTLLIWTGDTLVFSDGYEYQFHDRTLLDTALTCAVRIDNRKSDMLGYEHNQDLAMQGDNAARLIMQRIRVQRKQGTDIWKQWHDDGVASNAYLAEMCDTKDVLRWMRWGAPNKDAQGQERPFNRHQRATAVEAIIGAVDTDSGYNLNIVKEVMKRLGIWWPENAEQDLAFDRHLHSVRTARPNSWFAAL